MSNTTDSKIPQIVYSATSKRATEGEIFIKQHVFDYIISGTSEVYFGGKSELYKAGDFRFAARNRLSKFVKQPPEGGEYKSVSICIDTATLFELKNEFQLDKTVSYKHENVFRLKPNKHFNNYIDSLLPYLENQNIISDSLVKIKIKEAVLIFLEANPELKNILFDFSEPGKIDLEAYMNEHYQYNGSLEEFAYLTGRSLSTFKRDFEKIFSTTPNRWLLQKRLEEAYYLLDKKKMKATDVYVDVGFKDYSHFSISFKKLFGIAPSLV
ncbi:helix-turn-helix transcriptional regulator [Flavobacterium psychroterrae]|uniref:Helix-turn-helix transcriptional regulator n=1 Tax=Flavobacterium psychroterrae TaxID=2133767 RepID=A0ABS5P5E9_9FLAO|nr:AraC family transcriptional regulator [Flavobacterium psychroterrae]MBS7229479.1 helix-turn-helix transcriptional regulator [Flavobacterium psychroterrae]